MYKALGCDVWCAMSFRPQAKEENVIALRDEVVSEEPEIVGGYYQDVGEIHRAPTVNRHHEELREMDREQAEMTRGQSAHHKHMLEHHRESAYYFDGKDEEMKRHYEGCAERSEAALRRLHPSESYRHNLNHVLSERKSHTDANLASLIQNNTREMNDESNSPEMRAFYAETVEK